MSLGRISVKPGTSQPYQSNPGRDEADMADLYPARLICRLSNMVYYLSPLIFHFTGRFCPFLTDFVKFDTVPGA